MEEISNWKPLEPTKYELEEIENIKKLGQMVNINLTDFDELETFFGLIGDLGFYNEEFPGVPFAHLVFCGYTAADVVKMYATGVDVPRQWKPRFKSYDQRVRFIAEVEAYRAEHNVVGLALSAVVPEYREPSEIDRLLAAASARAVGVNVRALLDTSRMFERHRQGYTPGQLTLQPGLYGTYSIVAGVDPGDPKGDEAVIMTEWPSMKTLYKDDPAVLAQAASLSAIANHEQYLADIFGKPADPVLAGPNFVHNQPRQDHFIRLSNHIAQTGKTDEIMEIWESVDHLSCTTDAEVIQRPVLTLSYGGVSLVFEDGALEVLQARAAAVLGDREPYHNRIRGERVHEYIRQETGVDFSLLDSVLQLEAAITPENREKLIFAANVAAGGGNAIQPYMLDICTDSVLTRHLHQKDEANG